MTSAYYRLQDLTLVTADTFQLPERAMDVGPFGMLLIQARKAQHSAGAINFVTIVLQTSMTLDPESFEDTNVTFSFALGAPTPESKTLINPGRYLRWRSTNNGAGAYPVQFILDVLGRES